VTVVRRDGECALFEVLAGADRGDLSCRGTAIGAEGVPGGAHGCLWPAGHLARKAVVYLRQSSPKQVRENLESWS
jgi:hypothetical protein